MSPFRRKTGGREPAGANLARDLVERLGGGGERTALSFVDELGIIERISFADVSRSAARWAWLLRDTAVTPGDRVLVLAGRDLEWRPALLGALEAGAVAAVCPAETPVDQILDRARHCGAMLIVSAAARPDLDAAFAPTVLSAEEERPRLNLQKQSIDPVGTAARDVALVLHDDTTGALRGVTHTHGSLLAQALAGEHWLAAGPGARVWSTAPDGSAESIWTMLAAWGAGAELVAVGRDQDADQRLEFLESLAIDVLWLGPDEYRALAENEHPRWYDLSAIRLALSSPAVDSDTAERLHDAFGLSVGTVYGLPETGVLAASAPGETATGVAAGRAIPGLELEVVDRQGGARAHGEEGELVVRGGPALLFAGYWNAPRATASALRKDAFRTGARASLAADGALRVTGRFESTLELVEEADRAPDLLLEEAPVRAPLPHADPIVREREPEPEKLTRDERRRRREAEALRRVAERARLERDELERLRRERDERLVEEQRRLEARRLREQSKTKTKPVDRDEEVRRQEDEERRRSAKQAEREAKKTEAKRLKQERQVAAEQRRRAEEEKRRERDRQRREEQDAARASKAAAAEAKEAERRQREESARAELEREAAAAAERARLETEQREREEAERRSAEEARERKAAAAAEQARLETEQRKREEAERRSAEEAHAREAAAAAELARRAEEERLAAEQAAAAEQARLAAEEREREEAERRSAEEAREREAAAVAERARREDELRVAAERAEAENRRRAEEAARLEQERHEREAAEQAEREQVERAERERREREEAVAAEQSRLEHERVERQADERRRAAEAGRLQAEEEERRRAEEAARLEAEALLREAEQRRRREESARLEAERRQQDEAERRRLAVEEVARRQQVAAQNATVKEEERRRRRLATRRQRPEPDAQPEPTGPNPELLARIGRYGMTEGSPAPVPPEPAGEPDEDKGDGES